VIDRMKLLEAPQEVRHARSTDDVESRR
jgi:hypothetical protein